MALWATWQKRTKLVSGAPSHCWTSNDILANGLLKEMDWRNNPALACIYFFFRRDAEHATKMIYV
jgi:hypothetical protein